MSFRFRAVIATAVFFSLAGLASQGVASSVAPDEQLLPIAATLLQLPGDESVPAAVAAQPAVLVEPVAPAPLATPEVSAPVLAVEQPDDQTVYPTLAAAMAAQTNADDDAQLRCLAGAIYYESRGEPLAGQLAVAEVILNRAQTGRFGASACAVVTAPGQFSFVRGGHVPTPPQNADYRVAVALAKVATKDVWQSPASHALYFHARRVSPGWSRARVAAIGNHVFYR